MNRTGIVAGLVTAFALGGCGDGVSGPPLGDLGGTWDATLYEFRDQATGTQAVDLIEQGAVLEIVIDGARVPPAVTASFDDFMGNDWLALGVVNSERHELSIGGGIFSVVLTGNTMTLTNPEAIYSFTGGAELATVTIEATRR